MSRAVRHVPAALDAALAPELMQALRAALDGSGPAVLPVTPASADGHGVSMAGGGADQLGGEVPAEVALLVRTSGSTGDPREVMLTAEALQASIAATHHRLSGPGHWLLALPPAHIAGLQVLLRSAAAGTTPTLLPGPFRPARFTAAARRMPSDGVRYISLVPTQLHRLLTDPTARAELTRFDAVLLGGAAASDHLIATARAQGIRVVTTYGMSETCGGCVYDGVPLDEVGVELDADGLITLSGPILAHGYRNRPGLTARTFVTDADGIRWMRTADQGAWLDRDGTRLTVLGRADDLLITGGVKVAPAAVERVLTALPGVMDVCVVGVPDPQWGRAVTAVLVLHPGATEPDPAIVRSAVAAALGPAAAPRHQLVCDELPLLGPGKIDRREVATLAATRLAH